MPHRQSFSELRTGYGAGRLSPYDVAASALDHAVQVNRRVNAFALLDRERALTAAAASAERWQQGCPRSAIDGMPFTVKEFAAVEGWPTRRGSLTTSSTPATASSEFVLRLEQAGAVLLGKTRSPEFNWKGVTDSPGYGITCNPWNSAWTPGGSSGGCAAAVAAGVVRVSVGSDAGGSVRLPAAFTGTIGLKPTFGRIPVVPYPSHFSQIAHFGPIGASAADVDDAMYVLSGAAVGDWTSITGNARAWAKPEYAAATLRIGVLSPVHWSEAQGIVRAGMEQVVALLAGEGFQISEIDLDIALATEAGKMLYRLGCEATVRGIDRHEHARLDPGLLAFVRPVTGMSLSDYLGALRERDTFASRMAEIFETIDLLILPTAPITPFEVGHEVPPGWAGDDWLSWNPYTPAFNLSHHPALSYPVWPDESAVPVGVQLVAPPWREDRLLGLCAWLEQRCPVRFSPLADSSVYP